MAFDYTPLWDKYVDLFEPLSYEEIGRLIVSMMQYKSGSEPKIEGNERFIWPVIKRDIDAAKTSYDERIARQKQNGSKGGRPRKEKPDAGEENPKNPPVFPKTQPGIKKPKKDNSNCNSNCNNISPNGESISAQGARAPAVEAKKSFGEYGWVKLTEGEYNRLLNDLGQAEVNRCIAYVDESAQGNGNKNGWRDWNLIVRKCAREKWGISEPISRRRNSKSGNTPGSSTQPSADRIQKNGDWLDKFLREQEGENGRKA